MTKKGRGASTRNWLNVVIGIESVKLFLQNNPPLRNHWHLWGSASVELTNPMICDLLATPLRLRIQIYWVVLIFSMLTPPSFLGGQGYAPDQLLIKLEPGARVSQWMQGEGRGFDTRYGMRLKKTLSHEVGICLLTFDERRISAPKLLNLLRKDPMVSAVQLNHQVTWRQREPNDPLWGSQWQFENTGQNGGTADADIDATDAWTITQGGVTANGDTIVVCVIDQGIDPKHQDFGDNLWVNRAEIPDNEIDDDNNGYVDDYRGWSIITDNDQVDGGQHGTAVSGIVGARGDNDLGITGVNWRVKIMVVKNDFITNEAAVIEAYAYPLALRKRYNETNGQEGAFVVATNASWGVTFGRPEDAPLWCALYDSLGAAGILNIGATENLNINVDLEGDLPTACPSDFLISVTSTNRNDQKTGNAAFGRLAIDLGAPGEAVFTASSGNSYTTISGTSFAAPAVAGAVGLLYANPCPSFADFIKQNPAGTARLVKQAILNGVDKTPALDTLVRSGGRLNLYNSLEQLLESCQGCLLPYDPRATEVSDSSALISWEYANTVQRVDLRFRLQGEGQWQEETAVTAPFALADLDACSTYEVQFKTFCASGNSGYGPSLLVTTEGCCFAPSGLSLDMVDTFSMDISWDTVEAAVAYVVRYKTDLTSVWDSITTNESSLTITDLGICTYYEVQVRSACTKSAPLAWSSPLQVRTLGCGACTDLEYCAVRDIDAVQEWIQSVRLHTLFNESGPNGGYGDFTSLAALTLKKDTAYSIELVPGFEDVPFQEFFRVWMDFNRDGLFSENELLFRSDTASTEAVSGTITIPATGTPGSVRMRIGMRFRDLLPTEGCKTLPGGFGEYEDYCVEILGEDNACSPPEGFTVIGDPDEAVGFRWNASSEESSYLIRIDTILDGEARGAGSLFSVNTNEFIIPTELYTCNFIFLAEVQAVCGTRESYPSAPIRFRLPCVNNSPTLPSPESESIRVFPNPANRNNVNLDLSLPHPQSRATLELFRLDGRVVYKQILSIPAGNSVHTLSIPAATSGVLVLRLLLDDGTPLHTRLVIQ